MIEPQIKTSLEPFKGTRHTRRKRGRGKQKYECTQTSSMHEETTEYQSQINQSSEKAEKCVLGLAFIVPQHLQPPHVIMHCLGGESSPSLQGIP